MQTLSQRRPRRSGPTWASSLMVGNVWIVICLQAPRRNPRVMRPLTHLLTLSEGDYDRRIAVEHSSSAALRALGAVRTQVDGKDTSLVLNERALQDLIAPLCVWFHKALQEAKHKDLQRVIVGVMGPAGAGKSYLCAALVAACNACLGEGDPCAISLSMDAYHLPNSELEARTGADPITGERRSLKALKGVVESIGVQALVRDLSSMREPRDGDLPLPVYDRNLHEPVAGGIKLMPTHRLVLVEGLHLLHRDREWSRVGDALDLSIFLDVAKDVCRPRVVERKVANGRERRSAEEHFDRVDGPIYDRLQREKAWADLELTLDGDSNLVCATARRRLIKPPLAWSELADKQGKKRRKVLALGLNPALQRVVTLPGVLEVGEINRATEGTAGIGGKGQNFSKAAKLVDVGLDVTVAQFLGGSTGEQLAVQLEALGIHAVTQHVDHPTRCCTSIVHEHQGRCVTELVEPGSEVSAEAQAGMLAKLEAYVDEGGPVQGLAVMGSLPKGVPDDFYARALRVLYRPGTMILLDTVVGVDHSFKTGLPICMLKVNASELAKLNGRGPKDCGDRAKLFASAGQLLTIYRNIESLAVTAGAEKAWLFELMRSEDDTCRDVLLSHCYTLPNIPDEEMGSPIGAGDTVAAVTLSVLVSGCYACTDTESGGGGGGSGEDGGASKVIDAAQAYLWGLAAGSASCHTLHTADFKLSVMKSIASAIAVEASAQYLPVGQNDAVRR